MSQVLIHRDSDGERTHPVFAELADRLDAVRLRAFDRFSKRGTQAGNDLDDWIAAEREVMGWPAAELTEHDGAYEVDITLPASTLRTWRSPPRRTRSSSTRPFPPNDRDGTRR